MEKNKKLEGFGWARWAYRSIFLLVVALIVFAVFAAVKIWFIYSLYTKFIDLFSTSFGMDFWNARAFSILGTALIMLVLPWILSFLILGSHRVKVILIGAVVLTFACVAIGFGAKEVFFDRDSGKAIRTYVKTWQGYKTSSREDYDPKYGVKYQWFTPVIVKEYELWQETGKVEAPKIVEGQYFDQLTGDPKVWYAERPNGELWLSPLPGYDPGTKILLKPLTEEFAKNNVEKIKKAIKAGQTSKVSQTYRTSKKTLSEEGEKNIKNKESSADFDVNVYSKAPIVKDYLGHNMIELGTLESVYEKVHLKKLYYSENSCVAVIRFVRSRFPSYISYSRIWFGDAYLIDENDRQIKKIAIYDIGSGKIIESVLYMEQGDEKFVAFIFKRAKPSKLVIRLKFCYITCKDDFIASSVVASLFIPEINF